MVCQSTASGSWDARLLPPGSPTPVGRRQLTQTQLHLLTYSSACTQHITDTKPAPPAREGDAGVSSALERDRPWHPVEDRRAICIAEEMSCGRTGRGRRQGLRRTRRIRPASPKTENQNDNEPRHSRGKQRRLRGGSRPLPDRRVYRLRDAWWVLRGCGRIAGRWYPGRDAVKLSPQAGPLTYRMKQRGKRGLVDAWSDTYARRPS